MLDEHPDLSGADLASVEQACELAAAADAGAVKGTERTRRATRTRHGATS